MNNNECFICLDDLDESYKINKECTCILYVHEKCLFQWLQKCKQCPICRNKIDIIKEVIINIPIEPINALNIQNTNNENSFSRHKNKIIVLTLLVMFIIIMTICF